MTKSSEFHWALCTRSVPFCKTECFRDDGTFLQLLHEIASFGLTVAGIKFWVRTAGKIVSWFERLLSNDKFVVEFFRPLRNIRGNIQPR